jgi:hypothetical protein
MNLWRSGESRSGPGSSLAETEVIRARLPQLVASLGVRSMLDIPCGDLHWIREIDLPLESYIGADIVTGIIDANTARFASPQRSFVRLDLRTDPLPRVDLVLCRDCLDHLSVDDVSSALSNIVRSGSAYLLATTYPQRDENPDIRTGDWRPLNLQREPFSLPQPLELINESSRKPGYPDKSLGLWRVSDLAVSP